MFPPSKEVILLRLRHMIRLECESNLVASKYISNFLAGLVCLFHICEDVTPRVCDVGLGRLCHI